MSTQTGTSPGDAEPPQDCTGSNGGSASDLSEVQDRGAGSGKQLLSVRAIVFPVFPYLR